MTFARTILTAAAAAVLAASLATTAMADEATIRGASCFPQGSFFSKRFESFVQQVNETGKGVIRINYLGGAPAIGTPFTLIQKMASGVYDIASCTGAYYQNVVKEADAWKLLERSPAEIRENGGWALMEKIHRENNVVPLARTHFGTPFHLYLAEGQKIDKPDLTGKHLRVAPIYTNFFKAAGATTQTSDLAQIYTLMENGTVHGYGWPITGLQPGWEKVTKYRVDPGFYDADLQILANAEAWDKLPAAAREVMLAVAHKIEEEAVTADAAAVTTSKDKQAEWFETIAFNGADADKWLSTARQAGWAGVEEASPKYGPELRKLFAKE